MSQNKKVCAFRKRLQKAGYIDVSIKYQYNTSKNGRVYRVTCREPLAWQEVFVLISEKDMQNKFYCKKKGNK